MAYPTPDLPLVQEFKCVKIYVPTSVEDVFLSVLLGQITELTKSWYWVQSGTMTPEEASFLWAQALALVDADGADCVDCELVFECMRSAEGQQIIQDIVDGTLAEMKLRRLGQGVGSLDECSPDYVFGAVTYVVDYIHDSAVDLFEKLEVATNLFEIANEWLDDLQIPANIPTLILSFLTWVQDNIAENFDAQYTIALRDEYRCDLFCLYNENCQGLSPRSVVDYFLGRVSGEGFQENIEDFLEFLISGEWTGTQIADVTMAFVIGVMTVDINAIPFVNIPSLYSLSTVFELGANDPDGDWLLLCDECPPSTLCFDFDAMDNVTIVHGSRVTDFGNPQPSIKNADGVNSSEYPTNGSATNNGIISAVRIDFPTARSVSSVSYDYWLSSSAGTVVGLGIEILEDGTDTILFRSQIAESSLGNGAWHNKVFSEPETNVGAIVVWVFRMGNPTVTGNAYIDNVCIE